MVARASTRASRGFTLIEVIVASGVAIILLTAVMGYLLHRSRMDHQEAQLARLKQDATLVLGQLGRGSCGRRASGGPRGPGGKEMGSCSRDR